MKIGFFDSGIGGLTVLRDALRALPNEDYIYFADTKNVPYGVKPKEDVIKYVDQAVSFMAGLGIKALVVACNTATSIAINSLRQKYSFPIIGMEPAVKPAIANAGNKRILVSATSLTLQEEKLENLLERIDTNNLVDRLPLDKLVRFAEDFIFSGPEVEAYLKSAFNGYDFDNYEAIVLGCTHFVYYEEQILNAAAKPGLRIFDGNEGTVRRLISLLTENNMLEDTGSGKVEFYSSCEPETAHRITAMERLIR